MDAERALRDTWEMLARQSGLVPEGDEVSWVVVPWSYWRYSLAHDHDSPDAVMPVYGTPSQIDMVCHRFGIGNLTRFLLYVGRCTACGRSFLGLRPIGEDVSPHVVTG